MYNNNGDCMNILFDLDGTLSDPYQGISKGFIYCLDKLGMEIPDNNVLKSFIGPPLLDTFLNYYHMDQDEADYAVKLFREYYEPVGKYENSLYPDIKETLIDLSIKHNLYLCTGKPQQVAEDIIHHFEIDCLKGIYGSIDYVRMSKAEIISCCINEEHLDKKECIMVGDRKHDIIGAHEVGIPCIGVLYGYGSIDEFQQYECDYVVKDLSELKELEKNFIHD